VRVLEAAPFKNKYGRLLRGDNMSLTADDKEVIENISFRSARTVGDSIVAQLKEISTLENKQTRQSIEGLRTEMKTMVEHHANTCQTKTDVTANKNKAIGGWAVILAIGGLLSGVSAICLHFIKNGKP
jgi:CHASE3 domain sensor protein